MHRTIRLGAAVAYYALFALVPVLTVCLAVAGRVVSDGQVQEYLDDRLVEVFGPQAAGFSEAIASTLGEHGHDRGPRARRRRRTRAGRVAPRALLAGRAQHDLGAARGVGVPPLVLPPTRRVRRDPRCRWRARAGVRDQLDHRGDRPARSRRGDPRVDDRTVRCRHVLGARRRRVRPAVPVPARLAGPVARRGDRWRGRRRCSSCSAPR